MTHRLRSKSSPTFFLRRRLRLSLVSVPSLAAALPFHLAHSPPYRCLASCCLSLRREPYTCHRRADLPVQVGAPAQLSQTQTHPRAKIHVVWKSFSGPRDRHILRLHRTSLNSDTFPSGARSCSLRHKRTKHGSPKSLAEHPRDQTS